MIYFWRFHHGWNRCFHPLVRSFPSYSRYLYDDFPSDSCVAVQHLTVVVVAVNGARRKPGWWKTNSWRHRRRHSFVLPVPSSSPSNALCARAGDRACGAAFVQSALLPLPGGHRSNPLLQLQCLRLVAGQFPSCCCRCRLFYIKNLSFGSFERKRERERDSQVQSSERPVAGSSEDGFSIGRE
jgi:hypothetical protein